MRIRVPVISTVLFAAAVALGYSAPSDGAEGAVCLSVSVPTSPVPVATSVNDELKFRCGSMGEVTIPELYRNGWRVVSIWSQMAQGEGTQLDVQWAMVIEKL